jgi:N-acetylglucosaminyldiphosphoundecaprenol N-acetyl-beta-D-mannosaminyltransferase
MDEAEPVFAGTGNREAVDGPARSAASVSLHLTPFAAIRLLDLSAVEAARRLAARLAAPVPPAARAGSTAEAAPVRLVTVAFLNMRNYMALRRHPDGVAAYHDVDEVYPDGVGLQLARRILGLARFHRVAGTDLVPMLLERLRPGTRVYLLGATPAVSDAAATGFRRRFPWLVLAGSHHGYFEPAADAAVVADIARAAPDLLLVGMGSPLQERWIARNRHQLSGRVAICVGGLFHYWADDLHRAPRVLRGLGLEWLWILLQQPYKWRVYSIDAARFGAAVVRLKRLGYS